MDAIRTFVFMRFSTAKNDGLIKYENIDKVIHYPTINYLYLRPRTREAILNGSIEENRNGTNDLKITYSKNSVNQINDFLQRQQTPVCLVAHGYGGFHFLLLKKIFDVAGQPLMNGLLRMDSLSLFRIMWPMQEPYDLDQLHKHILPNSPNNGDDKIHKLIELFYREAENSVTFCNMKGKLFENIRICTCPDNQPILNEIDESCDCYTPPTTAM